MSTHTEDQARALMMRHHHLVKNRQQSMLGRAAAAVGLEGDIVAQGKSDPGFRNVYDRSNASLS